MAEDDTAAGDGATPDVADEQPGSDPEEPAAAQATGDADEESEEAETPSAAPPRPAARTAPGEISPTTTTGDPAKDVRGPSVTEEARRRMEGEPGMDEPGYGDLGHAEDWRVLHDD